MKVPLDVRCLQCGQVFCCSFCRRKHELVQHKLQYECSICRKQPVKIRIDIGIEEEFLKHLIEEHSPLRCLKCDEHFTSLADFSCLKNCVAPAESFRMGSEDTVSHFFERSFEKSCCEVESLQPTQSRGISEETAMDTTSQYDSVGSSLQHFISSASQEIVEHNKDSVTDKVIFATPYPTVKPVSKPKVAVIPRVLIDESIIEEAIKDVPTIQSNLEVKDCHNHNTPVSEYSATPAPMHATSTPTHPSSVPQWGMFQNTCSDSPLSEIDSPGTDNASPPVSISGLKESPATESSLSNTKSQRIKSIIGQRRRMEGQDSSEKCVTFADSVTVQTDGEISTERLKHEETEFGSPKPKLLRMPIKKVFRRPRSQTPGPVKPSKRSNPRFQAILNQFQNSSRMHLGSSASSSDTPSGAVNLPARALLFQQTENPDLKSVSVENSPLPEIKDSVINGENAVACIDSPLESRELFKSCIDSDSPALGDAKSNTESPSQDDLNTLSKNIASCIKRSIDSALDIEDGRAELHIKVTFTKTRNITHVQRNQDMVDENNIQTTTIWTSIARAVKGVIWGAVDGATVKSTIKKIPEVKDDTTFLTQRSLPEDDSATKRKLQELSDPVQSPLNHKKFRFEGRIKGRRPIDRMLRGNISGLERSNSAGGVDLVKRIDQSFKNKENDVLNHSF